MFKTKYILLVIGFILIALSCDNLDITSEQSKTFTKIFGSAGSDIGNDVKEFNGGYIILTTKQLDTECSEIVLLQTNNYGNPKSNGVDTLSSLRGGNNTASKLLLTQDGGFIVLGTVEDTLNNNTDIYINKFSSDFTSEWEKYIGTNANEVGNAIKKANTGYIITGSTDSDENGNGGKDIYLVKISETGDVEREEYLGFTSDDYSSDIIPIDNGYIIIGTTNLPDKGSEITFIKTNLSGTSYDVTTYGGTNNDYGATVVKTEDGGYIIVGNLEENAGGNSNIKLIKVDEGLRNIIWNRDIGGTALNDEAFEIVKSNGGFIIIGTKELASGPAAYFLKIDDESGETILENTYGGYGQTIYSIEKTYDGGFIMIGSSGTTGNEMIYLVKVNSEGEL